MYTSYNNRVTREHKRNIEILEGINNIINFEGMYNILYHMKKLNKYTPHIRFELFINLSVIRCYGLNKIQLRVLYNNLLFNSHIK